MKKNGMGRLCFVIIFLVVSSNSIAQAAPVRDPNTSASLFNGIGDFKNNSGQGINMVPALQTTSGLDVSVTKKVVGTAYFNNDWCKGYIRLKNGMVIDSMQLRYNDYKGELYFLDRNNIYGTKDSYNEFGFTQMINEQEQNFIFKNNFPPVGKNTAKTNYQFLAGESYQLLKLSTKELSETNGLDGQSYYKIIEEISYYVFRFSDSSIRKIKKGIPPLQADLPEIKDQITEISTRLKIKCKTEQELVLLFSLIADGKSESFKPF